MIVEISPIVVAFFRMFFGTVAFSVILFFNHLLLGRIRFTIPSDLFYALFCILNVVFFYQGVHCLVAD